jgi:hypothetical protein
MNKKLRFGTHPEGEKKEERRIFSIFESGLKL